MTIFFNLAIEKRYIIIAASGTLFIIVAALLLINHYFPGKPVIEGLDVIYKTIREPINIIPITGSHVKPVAYRSVLSFSDMDVAEKKQKFIDMMLPTILISKYKLHRQKERVRNCMRKERLNEGEQGWLDQQMLKFHADNYDELLSKMAVHPTSIILAQAALESAWGGSNLFQIANNIFGVWSFDHDDPRVKTRKTRQGKEIYVKQYPSLIESVDDYFLIIARGPYNNFRQARLIYDEPGQLVYYLVNYSEQREEYVRRLLQVIEENKLERFDNYDIDPDYLNEAT